MMNDKSEIYNGKSKWTKHTLPHVYMFVWINKSDTNKAK